MRDNGIELSEGLAVYGYSICSAIVTNCVKLVPLSQLAGQKILGESFELISSASEKAIFTDINDIGISGAGLTCVQCSTNGCIQDSICHKL